MSKTFGFKRAIQFATIANRDMQHNHGMTLEDEGEDEGDVAGKEHLKVEERELQNEIKRENEETRALCKNNFASKWHKCDKFFNGKRPDGYHGDQYSNTSFKFLTALQKNKAVEEEEKQIAKMAKVVGTAKTVDKASKSLLATTVRKRLKDRMKKIAEERLTVKQIFRRYVESSTLHGFRYTCSDTYLVRRVIWGILMILGTIYFMLKLHEGIIEYLSYPFSTLSTMQYVGHLDFPAISFCTINQFNYSKLQSSPLLTLYDNQRLPFQKNWSDPGFDIPGDELVKEVERTSFHIRDIFMDCDFIRQDTDHPNIPPRPCGFKAENFTQYFSESGQICFTLNSGKNKEILAVNHSGLKHGYEILFDLHSDQAANVHQFSGLQVIVHNQSQLSKSEVGFVLTPGFETYVSMQRTETTNLPPPYATQCGEKKLKYFETYTQKDCLLELLTDYTAKMCNCREPFMPDNNLAYCSLREKILCAFSAKESFNKHQMRKKCPIDCEITSYTNRISDSRFVHSPPKGVDEKFFESLKQKNLSSYVETLSKRYPDSKELDRYVQESIIKVIFFFGDMSKVVNEQEASFDFYQFLGDMGGEIGLMLGASLLTFFEFFDLLAFLAYHQLLRLHKKKKEQSESRKQSIVGDSRKQSIANERRKQSLLNDLQKHSLAGELKEKSLEFHASETSLVIPNNETIAL